MSLHSLQNRTIFNLSRWCPDMPRCCDCGLLATRDPVTYEFQEITKYERDSGRMRTDKFPSETNFSFVHARSPICFAMAADLDAEEKNSTITLDVIKKERDCPSYCDWHQGFSPKEHKEMQTAQDIRREIDEQRERDAKRQAEQKEADRKWQEQQKEADRKWQEQQKESDRQFQITQKRWDRAFAAVLAILTFVVGLLVRNAFNADNK